MRDVGALLNLAKDIFGVAVKKLRVMDRAVLVLDGVVEVLGTGRRRNRSVVHDRDALACAVARQEVVGLGSIRRRFYSMPVEFNGVRRSELHAVAGDFDRHLLPVGEQLKLRSVGICVKTRGR